MTRNISIASARIFICNALHDSVPFPQIKKREKYSLRSVTFSNVTNLLKVTLVHRCFLRFLNCTNNSKSPHRLIYF